MSESKTTLNRSARDGEADGGSRVHAAHAGPSASEAILMDDGLDGQGTLVRLRAGQKLAAGRHQSEPLFVARRGVFIVQAEWPERRPSILSLHYPGDFLPVSALPPCCEASIVAATTSEVLRFGSLASMIPNAKTAPLQDWLTSSLLNQQTRAAVHAQIVTGLDANERVASLFAEFALRLGQKTAKGFLLEVPLSRQMMADYLGLNADTMSRVVSTMKSDSILDQTSRHRYVIRDWRALCGLGPLYATIEALHSNCQQDFSGPMDGIPLQQR